MFQILISGDFGETLVAKAIESLELNVSYQLKHYRELDELKDIQYLIINDLYDFNFNDLMNIKSFIHQINQVEEGIIYNGDLLPRIKSHILFKKDVKVQKIAYGLNAKCDIRAANLLTTSKTTSFDLYIYGELFGHFELNIIGKDNLYRILAAITLGYLEQMDQRAIQQKLENYKGNIEEINRNIYMHITLESSIQLSECLETFHQISPYKMIVVVVPDAFPIESYLSNMKYVSKLYDASSFSKIQQDLVDCHILMIDSSLLI